MSFRRQVFDRHAFDEGLPDYALGEDRDMLYRIWREGWVIRCLAARATHHCDPAARPAGGEFGRMSVHHYLRIMGRIGRTAPGDRLVIGYTLAVLAAGMVVCAALRPARYGPQLPGMARGLLESLRAGKLAEPPERSRACGSIRRQRPARGAPKGVPSQSKGTAGSSPPP